MHRMRHFLSEGTHRCSNIWHILHMLGLDVVIIMACCFRSLIFNGDTNRLLGQMWDEIECSFHVGVEQSLWFLSVAEDENESETEQWWISHRSRMWFYLFARLIESKREKSLSLFKKKEMWRNSKPHHLGWFLEKTDDQQCSAIEEDAYLRIRGKIIVRVVILNKEENELVEQFLCSCKTVSIKASDIRKQNPSTPTYYFHQNLS